MYGPDGYGIIPESQPEDAQIQISAVEEDYVEIANPNKFAVDVSGWKLSGALDFDFIAGKMRWIHLLKPFQYHQALLGLLKLRVLRCVLFQDL